MKVLWMKIGILGAILLFAVITLSLVCAVSLKSVTRFADAEQGLYAVFLDNGQVYFGNVAKENQDTVLLQNIYYIQMQGTGQEGLATQTDVSLLKLGNELHGPEDWMKINKDHILFVEKLKSDGKVAKAIADYKQK